MMMMMRDRWIDNATFESVASSIIVIQSVSAMIQRSIPSSLILLAADNTPDAMAVKSIPREDSYFDALGLILFDPTLSYAVYVRPLYCSR